MAGAVESVGGRGYVFPLKREGPGVVVGVSLMPITSLTDERFAAAAERLPTTPQIYDKLNSATKNPDVSVEEIVAVVRLDAALSARLLRLSNGMHFSRGGERVADLAEAVNRIGFSEVFRVVGAAMASQLYVTGLPIYGVGGDELWANSITTALAAEILAEQSGQDKRLAYTAGLLRPVGRLILQKIATGAMCPPMSGRKATGALVNAWEKETFSLTNMEAAERLCRLWNLPAELGLPIRHHFEPAQDELQKPMTALLHLASCMAEKMERGLSIEKETWTVTDEILAQASIGADVVEESLERTRVMLAKMETLLKAA